MLAADIEFARLPQAAFDACTDAAQSQHCLLAGGDDYELAFSRPARPTRTTSRRLPRGSACRSRESAACGQEARPAN